MDSIYSGIEDTTDLLHSCNNCQNMVQLKKYSYGMTCEACHAKSCHECAVNSSIINLNFFSNSDSSAKKNTDFDSQIQFLQIQTY